MGAIDKNKYELHCLLERWLRLEPEFMYASNHSERLVLEFYRLGRQHGRSDMQDQLDKLINMLESKL